MLCTFWTNCSNLYVPCYQTSDSTAVGKFNLFLSGYLYCTGFFYIPTTWVCLYLFFIVSINYKVNVIFLFTFSAKLVDVALYSAIFSCYCYSICQNLKSGVSKFQFVFSIALSSFSLAPMSFEVKLINTTLLLIVRATAMIHLIVV